ncbi:MULTISPECIES: MogA/MoaB family molybdenum cofactor biosynthesis protein [Sporosarcina]|uniref:Molybdenum cofactor biosynthesis protein B n=1 Tax=Sporosarcina contaminans TaxID=633403 RepID=A0ABW3TY20_9BACL
MSHLENTVKKPVAICILTVSDTRTMENDKSGATIKRMAEAEGHSIVDYRISTDDPSQISKHLQEWLKQSTVEAIILTGGTGISHRDQTIETVTPYFTKPLDGFGELFRFLSYSEDVGSKALLSRAVAGAIHEKVLFALPGSSKAVELGMRKLILPELHHIVRELTKHLD